MAATVAIVGRPNVGKSTLFNRFVGRRLALVDDKPGVTRDRREGHADLAGLGFTVYDTAELENADDHSLAGRMVEQTREAVADADVVLFVIDGRAGVTPLDRHFAEWLRQSGRPIILVANKCESRASDAGYVEAYELGFGEPVAISAEHGLGLTDLVDAVREQLERAGDQRGGDEDEESEDEDRPVRLAIVGRPNVGKSTLVNTLIGEERLVTGPEAGITRDAIEVEWTWRDRAVRLVDTAGLRRKARVVDRIERMSVDDTLRTIRFAEIVVLVLDAQVMLERQDLTIAAMVAEEGRGLVIAANKWDLVDSHQAALAALHDRITTSLPQIKGVPVVTLSAKRGAGTDRLLEAVFELHGLWNRRVPTGELNRWLAETTERHPPPMASGRRLRLRYMTQIKTRPPTFAIFVSKPANLPESYLRYLANALREDFGFKGVPLRLYTRKGKNPYA